MKIALLISFLISTNYLFSQSFTDLQKLLSNRFSENLNERYIFKPEKDTIEKIENLSLKSYFPNYEFYTVVLTYRMKPSWVCRCVIFYDSARNTMILQEPLSMKGLPSELLSLLKSFTFTDSTTLMEFLKEFHLLRQIGSKYKFIQKASNDSLLSFDLVFFQDQDFINRPFKETLFNKYETSQIVGKFYIKVAGNTIQDYIELSPSSPNIDCIASHITLHKRKRGWTWVPRVYQI